MWRHIFNCDEEDGYTPYCDVKIEASPEFIGQIQGHLPGADSALQTEDIKYNAVESALPPTLNLYSSERVYENHSVHINEFANNNRVNFAPTKCSKKLSSNTDVISKLFPSSDKCTAVYLAGSFETGPPHESDDSDSEMFRVKQRSNLSIQKRRAGEMFSDVSQQQVQDIRLVDESAPLTLKLKQPSVATNPAKVGRAIKLKPDEHNGKVIPQHNLAKTSREPSSTGLRTIRLKVWRPSSSLNCRLLESD